MTQMRPWSSCIDYWDKNNYYSCKYAHAQLGLCYSLISNKFKVSKEVSAIVVGDYLRKAPSNLFQFKPCDQCSSDVYIYIFILIDPYIGIILTKQQVEIRQHAPS